MTKISFNKSIEIDGVEYKCKWAINQASRYRPMTEADAGREAILGPYGNWVVQDVSEALTLDIYDGIDYKLIESRITPWLAAFGFRRGLCFSHFLYLAAHFSRDITDQEATRLGDHHLLEALGAMGAVGLDMGGAITTTAPYLYHGDEGRREMLIPRYPAGDLRGNVIVPPYQAQWDRTEWVPALWTTARATPTAAQTITLHYTAGLDFANDFARRIDNNIINGSDNDLIVGDLETPTE